MYVPTKEEFLQGIRAFKLKEPRGTVYFEALKELREGWGDPKAMAGAIAILLRSWHLAFYRFGTLDDARLVECVREQLPALVAIRERNIDSLDTGDEELIRNLFNAFRTALRGGKGGVQESGVAPAKALHLIAPGFLPIWDNAIAYRYGWVLMWPHDYVFFCWQMKEMAAAVASYMKPDDKCTVLKRVDEFNYSAYTKYWISVGHKTDSGQPVASAAAPTEQEG